MKIEILGTGCARCDQLERNARAAAEQAGITCEVSKVRDLAEIAARGVLITPALLIDGVCVASGKVPAPDEIQALLERETA